MNRMFTKILLGGTASTFLVASLLAAVPEKGKAKLEVGATSLLPPLVKIPLGLDQYALEIPRNNGIDGARGAAKVELGKRLFFDTRLSKDETVACSTCHDPKKGWSNGDRFATGVGGVVGDRNSPTIVNRAFGGLQFWDGRSGSLEEQALGPMQNSKEMAQTLDGITSRLSRVKGYAPLFVAAFGSKKVTSLRLARSIASFERTIVTGNSPYDRYEAGDRMAMSESAIRGKKLFFDSNKGRCSVCHAGFNFTDEKFHNLGVGAGEPNWESSHAGRFAVTKNEADRGAFKTPTLRDCVRSAPFMHDGSEKTLEDVVELYAKGGKANPHLDKEMKPLDLNAGEKGDLVEFLKALTGEQTEFVPPPRVD